MLAELFQNTQKFLAGIVNDILTFRPWYLVLKVHRFHVSTIWIGFSDRVSLTLISCGKTDILDSSIVSKT